MKDDLLKVEQARPRVSPLMGTVVLAGCVFILIALFTQPPSDLMWAARSGWLLATAMWIVNYYMIKLAVDLHNKLAVSDAILRAIKKQADDIVKDAKDRLDNQENK